MTNQQLAILLHNYKREILREIEVLKEVVPSKTGKNMLGQEYSYYPALGALIDIVNNLGADVELLGREE